MSEDSVIFPRRLAKQFIQMYKENECLWNRKSHEYKLKMKRLQAIAQLTELVQSFDPAATRVHVMRKIDSFRACVRREHKKVMNSMKVATCQEEVYVPQLWYYDLFGFVVRQQEEQAGGKKGTPLFKPASPTPNPVSSEEEEAEEEASENDIIEHIEIVKSEPTYEIDCVEFSSSPPPACSKRPSPREEPRRKRRHRADGQEDEYDAIGINVAAKLRYLPDNMRILAEKLISDVLFQAQTNALSGATRLFTPDPFR